MIRDSVSPEDAIAFLNGLLAIDEKAVLALIAARVPCNEALSDHPTVQICSPPESPQSYTVGILGVFNGLFGTLPEGPRKGWGPIMLVSGPDEPSRFALTEEILGPIRGATPDKEPLA